MIRNRFFRPSKNSGEFFEAAPLTEQDESLLTKQQRASLKKLARMKKELIPYYISALLQGFFQKKQLKIF